MRRTKAEALQTRARVVAAARGEFAQRGVSQTTMEHIASAAEVTRGAVYGHFMNKDAVFAAMRECVRLPLYDAMNLPQEGDSDDPFAAIGRYLRGVLEAIASDKATRDTLRIMIFRCEYVGDLERELGRQETRLRDLTAQLTAAYRRAADAGMLAAGAEPELAALETAAFLTGIIRMWYLDRRGTFVRKRVEALIDSHLQRFRRPA